ncbi:RNA-binding S4 domain-containing protein [Paracoccus sp. (in: a-proteobacteria)]|uniref:RNA-binding S4 domain-containing protein n=1 Tax=Paracoccus sp. TaxID=267 RepID=UPI0026E06C44|nr:RNA-binding S4 domain-containing protein [Paracoccus sp. (in: a-proteobacteria)]MDO5646402.1 RNA-binding S4 domain-containing protein [Paracoccus sp. (in: a-proteobacteria)]
MTDAPDALRLDKWLVFARVFKTRALAMARIEGGGVRVNGQPCRKPGKSLRIGDEITVSAHGNVRALRVLGLGARRGPASEAQQLYQDLTDGLIDPAQGIR